MNPTSIALLGLSYTASSGPSSNLATIALASTPMKVRLMEDLTNALQEIYEIAKWGRRQRAFNLLAPREITLNVTDNSATVTTSDTFTEGATVFVGGIFNQIFTENAVKSLLFPYSGAAGAVTATLYSDVIVLDSTVSEVKDQVYIADSSKLFAAANLSELVGAEGWVENDFGMYRLWSSMKPAAGTPCRYFAEDFLLTTGTNHVMTRRLRVHPLPSALTQIGVLVSLRAPTFTVADIGTDLSPSTRTFTIPDDYQEKYLRWIFLDNWAGSPWFKAEAAKATIREKAAAARLALAEKHTQQRKPMRLRKGV